MKKTVAIDIGIIALALPVAVTVAVCLGASQSLWELSITALNPFCTGILTNSDAQALILVGPLFLFLCLTILAIVKEKLKTSYLCAFLTSACWAFLMFGTIFVRFGP